jgi:hypothetical protein
VEEAHHDLGVDQILGTAEGDKTDLWPGSIRIGRGTGFNCCRKSHSLLVYQPSIPARRYPSPILLVQSLDSKIFRSGLTL